MQVHLSKLPSHAFFPTSIMMVLLDSALSQRLERIESRFNAFRRHYSLHLFDRHELRSITISAAQTNIFMSLCGKCLPWRAHIAISMTDLVRQRIMDLVWRKRRASWNE
jgi:hypothetical protein